MPETTRQPSATTFSATNPEASVATAAVAFHMKSVVWSISAGSCALMSPPCARAGRCRGCLRAGGGPMVSARSVPIMPYPGRRCSQCPPAWRQPPGPGRRGFSRRQAFERTGQMASMLWIVKTFQEESKWFLKK